MSRTILIVGAVSALVAVLCIIAVNVQNARQQRAYSETELTLLGNGLLLEIFRHRFGTYPSPGYEGPLSKLPDSLKLNEISAELQAIYPWRWLDAWGNRLMYSASSDGLHYLLVSTGSGAALDEQLGPDSYPAQFTNEWTEDIVLKDGSLSQWRGGWCCNPRFQEWTTAILEERVRTGELG